MLCSYRDSSQTDGFKKKQETKCLCLDISVCTLKNQRKWRFCNMKAFHGVVGLEASLGWSQWGLMSLFQDMTLSGVSVLWVLVTEIHPKGDQSWVFIERTDAQAETPILWPPHAKSWLTGKDPDAGRDWGQEEKGTTEDEMAGCHHRLDGHGFE